MPLGFSLRWVVAMANSLAYLITKFFSEHLPLQVGASPNTIHSYRDAMVQLLDFLGDQSTKAAVALEDLDEQHISDFLIHLEADRGISVSTRNQRLAAIHSFIRYVQRKELSCYDQCARVLSMPFKKTGQKPMGYLSVEEVRLLMSIPDSSTRKGIRALAMLAMLYETGARVQEVIDLTPARIHINENPRVELYGKGRKVRMTPISEDVASILGKYIALHGIDNADCPLFANSQGNKLTRAGVQHIVDKYVALAKTRDSSMFTIKVTNHTFRHSKAVHLLEAGVNLIYIRDFLGHSSVTTTEVYAKVSPVIKRRHLLEHSMALGNGGKYSISEKSELLDWLRNGI
jgi:site-specific recombinase XerD